MYRKNYVDEENYSILIVTKMIFSEICSLDDVSKTKIVKKIMIKSSHSTEKT